MPHGHDNMCTGFIVLRGDFQRQALRARRRREGPLPHPADDRPGVQAGRVLDDLRPQGQRPLVQGGVGYGVHLQRPHPRLQPGQRQRPRPRLRGPGGREDAGRPHRGQEDLQRVVPQEVRVRRGRGVSQSWNLPTTGSRLGARLKMFTSLLEWAATGFEPVTSDRVRIAL